MIIYYKKIHKMTLFNTIVYIYNKIKQFKLFMIPLITKSWKKKSPFLVNLHHHQYNNLITGDLKEIIYSNKDYKIKNIL